MFAIKSQLRKLTSGAWLSEPEHAFLEGADLARHEFAGGILKAGMSSEELVTPSDRENVEDDPVALSSSTLAVLNQFLLEQSRAEKEAVTDPFAENWGMSQVGR